MDKETEPVTPETPEEYAKKQPADPEPVFTDLDDLKHAVSLVEEFLKTSRKSKFKPVSVSFEQLESLLRCLTVGADRTDKFSRLANSLKGRDTAIVSALSAVEAKLDFLAASSYDAKSAVKSVAELAKFFLPKE
jgi:hypothetical protein